MIADEQSLAALIEAINRSPYVAIDTEADSLHAYPEKLCLIQVSIAGLDELVDPLSSLGLAPFFTAIGQRQLLMHGADYDIRLFRKVFNFVPREVFDTTIAARLLGYKEVGLTDLVFAKLGVRLEKGPQKMNWALRPLPERMLVYARNDTRYLPSLVDILRSELAEKGRLQWMTELCAKQVIDAAKPREVDKDEVWRVAGSEKLSPAGLAILRELWHWRDLEAIAANTPPFFIMSHRDLADISDVAQAGGEYLKLVPRNLSTARREKLKKAVEAGLARPSAEHPQKRRFTSRVQARGVVEKSVEIKQRRDKIATDLAIDPTLIANKATLFALAEDWTAAAQDLLPWQRELLESSPDAAK